MCNRSHLKDPDDPVLQMLLSEGDDLDPAHVQRFLHRIMKMGRAGVPLREAITDRDMRGAWERSPAGESTALIGANSNSPRIFETSGARHKKMPGRAFARSNPAIIISDRDVFRDKRQSTQ